MGQQGTGCPHFPSLLETGGLRPQDTWNFWAQVFHRYKSSWSRGGLL